MRRVITSWGFILSAALVFTGCGGSGGGNGGSKDAGSTDAGIDASTTPFELSNSKVGVMFHHGAAGHLGYRAREAGDEVAKDRVQDVKETFGAGFLHVQLYDEHAHLRFGDWTVQPPPDSLESSPDYYTSTEYEEMGSKERGRFQNRSKHLSQRVEETFGFGEQGVGDKGIVLDFWRMRGDWYVQWEGILKAESNRRGEGDWGFYQQRFRTEVSGQIEAVAERERPEYLVVGSDMGRLLGREGEPGLAPDEFLNFRQFYSEIADKLGNLVPKTRVGVGFDWDRFAKQIAPAYGEGEKGSVPPPETLAKAFESVILPLARKGGLIALKAYRKPAESRPPHYRFLATLDQRYELGDTELIWYSVGTPIESSTSYRRQANFLRNFVDWNEGVSPDRLVWGSLINVSGVDQGDGSIGGRCSTLRDDPDFEMQLSQCFDGLISNTIQRKDVFDFLYEETVENSE